MKLEVLNFTGSRDADLADAMKYGISVHAQKHSPRFHKVWCDNTNWGNGAGWEASMMKVLILKGFNFLADDDYLLCSYSDVLVFTPQVFDWVEANKPEFCGIRNVITVETLIGPLNHIGGCFTFIRGDALNKINRISWPDLQEIRNQFKAVDLCENEDVVISYLAKISGIEGTGLPPFLWSGGIEQDLREGKPKSFYHVNYSPTSFLGVPVTGKWDIGKVLRKKGYIL